MARLIFWLGLAVALVLLTQPAAQPVVTPVVTPAVAGTCNPELIRLAQEVLQDERMREPNHGRLRALDTSGNMAIAIELMSNKRLSEIVKKEQVKCR